MKRLKAMMEYTRAHGGEGERLFVERFIKPYNPETFIGGDKAVLAYVVQVAGADKKTPPILFSSHTDTVHALNDPVKQKILYDKSTGLFFKDDKRPLGADDGAGVWLMLEMIDAKVPGTYIFHRGEERGGIGSRGMEQHHSKWLSQFKWAIAFDRRGTEDVITEMACGRVCSELFAAALADKLNGVMGGTHVNPLTQRPLFTYAPDNTGIFTDTANYRRIIPECTNISVGYDAEHTGDETLDWWHLEALRAALISVFGGVEGTGELPVERDPAEKDPEYSWGNYKYDNYNYNYKYDNSYGVYDNYTEKDPRRLASVLDDVIYMTYEEVVDWVAETSPEEVAEIILRLTKEIA